jgi:LPXTG-motif cell wall-anchored protein
MLLLGALALAVPAVTVASGGGSAGDQQYTDPFSGTTTSSPATSTAPPTTSAATHTTTGSVATTTPVASTQTASDPTTPTATIASSTSSTAGQLPHTGYDSRLAAALGFALVGGGLALRARLRRGP